MTVPPPLIGSNESPWRVTTTCIDEFVVTVAGSGWRYMIVLALTPTVIDTVTVWLHSSPSCTRYVNESVPW